MARAGRRRVYVRHVSQAQQPHCCSGKAIVHSAKLLCQSFLLPHPLRQRPWALPRLLSLLPLQRETRARLRPPILLLLQREMWGLLLQLLLLRRHRETRAQLQPPILPPLLLPLLLERETWGMLL
jgi:hypothetical protein